MSKHLADPRATNKTGVFTSLDLLDCLSSPNAEVAAMANSAELTISPREDMCSEHRCFLNGKISDLSTIFAAKTGDLEVLACETPLNFADSKAQNPSKERYLHYLQGNSRKS